MNTEPKVFTISCYSDCGSYFSAYLQEITVIAADREEAIKWVKDYLMRSGKSFIYPENKWEIEFITDQLTEGTILNVREESDY